MSIFVFFAKLIVAAFVCAVAVEISALLMGCLVLIRDRCNLKLNRETKDSLFVMAGALVLVFLMVRYVG